MAIGRNENGQFTKGNQASRKKHKKKYTNYNYDNMQDKTNEELEIIYKAFEKQKKTQSKEDIYNTSYMTEKPKYKIDKKNNKIVKETGNETAYLSKNDFVDNVNDLFDNQQPIKHTTNNHYHIEKRNDVIFISYKDFNFLKKISVFGMSFYYIFDSLINDKSYLFMIMLFSIFLIFTYFFLSHFFFYPLLIIYVYVLFTKPYIKALHFYSSQFENNQNKSNQYEIY